MKRRRHMLPDGTTTTSASRYVKEWRDLAEPIERRLGVRLWAFDPDLALRYPGGGTFYVGTDLAREFARLDAVERDGTGSTP